MERVIEEDWEWMVVSDWWLMNESEWWLVDKFEHLKQKNSMSDNQTGNPTHYIGNHLKEQGQVGQWCVLFQWTFFMNECFLWMNVFLWINVICEWINDLMSELLDVFFFYWVRTTFLLKKCLLLMFLMNALQTDQPTDQRTQPIIEMRGRI